MANEAEYLVHAGSYLAGFREGELVAMVAAMGMAEGARSVTIRRDDTNRLTSAVTTPVTPELRKQARHLRRAARALLRSLERPAGQQ